jgi:hypothetical protein
MAKRMNKADSLVFKALQKAFDEDKLHLCLINSKINIPGSPVYNPWETLLPILCPVMLGLILIWGIGILWGLVVMIAGIMLSSNLVKKRMEQRLFDRSKKFFTSSYSSCNQLWDFGGIVLVKAEDKKQGCIAPEGNWKNFVILNFSEYMTEGKKEEKVPDEKVA